VFKVGENILGKYIIKTVLKPGNFGTVFIVHNYGIDRVSVLKIAVVGDPTSFKEVLEAYIHNLCSHDHILKIYSAEIIDVNTPAGPKPAVAMELEYADGGTLSNLMGQSYLPIRDSIRHTIDCLFALEFAHSKDIVHGDMKPDNVLISNGKIKIADFGLSKNSNLVGPQRPNSQFYRTHGAPELFLGGDIGRATDVFAASMTLFRLANNIVDWHGVVDSIPNHEELSKTGLLINRLGFSPEVPRRLRQVIKKACAPDPKNRFQNCTEFRNALSKLVCKSVWRCTGPNEWISDQKGRVEVLSIETSKGIWELVYTLNGRRKGEVCKPFQTPDEAIKAQNQFLYENTLS
jgi:eukaryotic-like serine/threonine-protein kinase